MVARLLVNGKVFTGTGEKDFATAFYIVDGVVEWVGETADAPIWDTDSQVVDLKGATVLPGLLDVHTHPAFISTLTDSVALLPPKVNSRGEMLDALRSHENHGKGPEDWIEGFGYNEARYPEGRPTRYDLDKVSTTQPVFARRADVHTAVCNSFALQLAGVTRDTPNPPGAEYERDQNGEPTGLLVEMGAVESVYRCKPKASRDEFVSRVVGMNDHFMSCGIVAVNDLMATFVPDPIGIFREAERHGFLPQCGLFLGWGQEPLPDLTDADRGGRVFVAGVKLFLDGAYSNRTAWTEGPYRHSDEHGMRACSDDDLRGAAHWARRNKVQVAVHAMGDRALNHLLNLFEDEEPWMGERPSMRFEHSTLLTEEMMHRINDARMKFGVVTHSIFFFAEYDSYEANLSAEQFAIAYPIRSIYENVREIALSSDSPATAWADCDDVFLSVKAAVVRRAYNGADIGQGQAVSVGQALELYTGRARMVTTLRDVGTIEVGREGSFVVLDRDVFTICSEEIDQVHVAQTWLRGEKVFQRASRRSPLV